MLAGSVDDSFAVIRLNIDGSLDATFGSGGMQSYPNIPGTANAVALQTDGRIVMAAGGEGQKANGSEGQFLVARLDPNGTLDTSVDNTGFLTVVGPGLGDGFNPNGTNAVVVEPDGRIVADGSSDDPNIAFQLARIDANGTLDPTFGNAGLQTVAFNPGSGGDANALALTPDGKLVVAGLAPVPEDAFGVARLVLGTSTPTPTSPTPTSPTPTSPTRTPTSPTPTSPPPNPTPPPVTLPIAPAKPPTSPTSGAHRTKTLLSAQPRPANVGRKIVFTAAVEILGHGGGTPIGVVTFYDGTKVLGQSELKRGGAKISTSSLMVGTHSIHVVYAGSGNFYGSDSKTLNEKIRPGHSKSLLSTSAILVQVSESNPSKPISSSPRLN